MRILLLNCLYQLLWYNNSIFNKKIGNSRKEKQSLA